MRNKIIIKAFKVLVYIVFVVAVALLSYLHGYFDSVDENYGDGVITTYSYRYIWCDTVLTDTGYREVLHFPNEKVYKIEDPEVIQKVKEYNLHKNWFKRCFVWKVITNGF